MEEASEEHHLSASGRIRWSSNILIGSIPLKKSLFSLITLMFGLEQRGQFHLFTPSLSRSLSPRLNKLAQQLIYTKQTQPQPQPQKTLQCPLQASIRRTNISYSKHVALGGKQSRSKQASRFMILFCCPMKFLLTVLFISVIQESFMSP